MKIALHILSPVSILLLMTLCLAFAQPAAASPNDEQEELAALEEQTSEDHENCDCEQHRRQDWVQLIELRVHIDDLHQQVDQLGADLDAFESEFMN